MHVFLAQHTAISSIISIQISDIWCVVTDAGLIHWSAIKLPTTKYGRQNTQYGRQKKNFLQKSIIKQYFKYRNHYQTHRKTPDLKSLNMLKHLSILTVHNTSSTTLQKLAYCSV